MLNWNQNVKSKTELKLGELLAFVKLEVSPVRRVHVTAREYPIGVASEPCTFVTQRAHMEDSILRRSQPIIAK